MAAYIVLEALKRRAPSPPPLEVKRAQGKTKGGMKI